jgi:hypothetical protein
LHLCCSVSDHPLQVGDPSSLDADYAKKRRLLNGAAEPFSDECCVPRYSEVTAARSPIFSCVPRIHCIHKNTSTVGFFLRLMGISRP